MKHCLLVFFYLISISFSPLKQDIPVGSFDKGALETVNKFMTALHSNSEDEMAAAKAALPFIHRSEYDASGSSLKQDRLDYSFKKAWQNAKLYQSPVKVMRIQKQSITAIGFGATAQKGSCYKVFIAKKDISNGLPAPLNVFIPGDGSEAKIYYYGSL